MTTENDDRSWVNAPNLNNATQEETREALKIHVETNGSNIPKAPEYPSGSSKSKRKKR